MTSSNHYLDLAWTSPFAWFQPVFFSSLFILYLRGMIIESLWQVFVLNWVLLFVVELVKYFTFNFPCYFPTPIFGLKLIRAMQYHDCFHESARRDQNELKSRVYMTWLWHNPLLNVHDVTALKDVLKNQWRSFDRSWYEISAFRHFLG